MAKKSARNLEKAAEIYANNIGTSVGKSMIKAGYSRTYANNPQRITKTDKWGKLMDKYFPDKDLAEGVKTLIHSPKVIRKYVQGNIVEETEQIDAFAINAGLTHAFKLKNKYPSEKLQVEHSFPVPLLDVTSHQAKLVPTNTETLPANK